MLDFRAATIVLSESYSLKSLTWQLAPGQCCVVTGPNGCGKSALLAVAAGEGLLSSGERHVSAERIAVVSLEEQGRLIARERQRDDSDITDEVSEGTPVQSILDEGCLDPLLQQQLVTLLGLEPLLTRGFRRLSTGETRKVLLIRALASRPDLLILDEPFEGLDAVTAPEVRDLITEIATETTLLVAVNRLDQVPDATTQVLRLEHGVIAQSFDCASGNEARTLLETINHIRSDAVTLPPPLTVNNAPLNNDGSLVRLHNASIAYTDNIVFERLNWSIRTSEHWQVKGRNGSGKTCLLSLITGDHPQCYVNDIALFGFQRGQGESIWQIKQYLGFVSTSLHWDYRLSVGVRNVIISGFHDSVGLYQAASDRELEIADAWLLLLGLAKRAGEPFSSLSYGEQRLVLIARAMVKHPTLLLLDEPCLGLDEGNRQLVLALIERICAEGNTTVIYVTHHQEDAVPAIKHVLDLSALH